MKLNHIVIPNNTDKTNEELFIDTMETYMGEIEIETELTFIHKDNNYYYSAIGKWVNEMFDQKKSYCKGKVDALYIEDESGNITEYFVLTEYNTIKHEIV